MFPQIWTYEANIPGFWTFELKKLSKQQKLLIMKLLQLWFWCFYIVCSMLHYGLEHCPVHCVQARCKLVHKTMLYALYSSETWGIWTFLPLFISFALAMTMANTCNHEDKKPGNHSCSRPLIFQLQNPKTRLSKKTSQVKLRWGFRV